MRAGNMPVSGIRRTCRFYSSSGFSLTELVVVIVVLGILTGIAIPVYVKLQASSRDETRLGDMRTLEGALEQYKSDYDCYPVSDFQGPGGWDDPSDGDFITYLTTAGYLEEDKTDTPTTNLRFYRYNAGSYGCDSAGGPFYVLGVLDIESSGRPHPDSPGWYPPGSTRNWQNEFDWVTGCFTNVVY